MADYRTPTLTYQSHLTVFKKKVMAIYWLFAEVN